MIRLYQKVYRSLSLGSDGKRSAQPVEGYVVYIHPEGRFYSVEFTFPAGKFRESFNFTPEEKEEARQSGIISCLPPAPDHPHRRRGNQYTRGRLPEGVTAEDFEFDQDEGDDFDPCVLL